MGKTSQWRDLSGTIAAGGTAQALAPLNKAREQLMIQNLSSADIYWSEVGDASATQPSFRVAPGQLYENPPDGCPQGAISIFGATTGQAFSARERT